MHSVLWMRQHRPWKLKFPCGYEAGFVPCFSETKLITKHCQRIFFFHCIHVNIWICYNHIY
jgi:hypothetical protein